MFLRFLFILILTAVSFSIDKTYVLDIVFSGNETIQDSELKDLLRLKGKTFLSTTEFKSNKLNLDLIALKSFYQSQGYLDVEIDYSYEKVNESNVSIDFLIFEGKRYKIKEISIIGNKSFEDSYILDLIKSDSEYYNPLYIRTQLVSLKNEYLKIGRINISINEEVVKQDGAVELYIYISEGNKFYIDDIIVSGLEKIDKKLVFRELIFNVGDLYNVDRLDKSKSYIFESQLFSSVEMFPYINSDTTVSLDIRLRELRRREIEFEFGFSQLPSNQGDLPVSAINFSGNIDRGNLFNSATKLSFMAEYGFSYSNDSKFLRSYYELGLYSPWFIRFRIPFRFKIYNENILFNTFLLGDKKTGVIAYIENYRSSNPYLSAGVNTEFFETNKNQNRSIYISYMKHNIENFITPLNGYYISLTPRLNGTFLGGAYSYFKNDIEIKIFKNIFKEIIFAARMKTGFIYKINSKTGNSLVSEIPNFDKFFLGGASSLRGWSSPVDYNREEGGLGRGLLNCEIRIPLYKIIGLELFYDAGFLNSDFFNDISNIDDDFNWNIGWGIVIQSALGPARLDFAFKNGTGNATIQVSLLNMF